MGTPTCLLEQLLEELSGSRPPAWFIGTHIPDVKLKDKEDPGRWLC